MRFALRVLAVLVIGTALGVLATWATVVRGTPGDVSNGPWRTSLLVGSAASGPYLRASVALHGLLALNRHETIYFSAARDSAGDTLEGNCTYRLVGRDPAARWWSITAYGPDDYLIPNAAHHYSVSKTSVAREDDGSFIVMVAKGDSGPNWVPVGTGPFSLSLRLYNPAPAVAADPARIPLPTIDKAGCS